MMPLRSSSGGASQVKDKVRELMATPVGFSGAPTGTIRQRISKVDYCGEAHGPTIFIGDEVELSALWSQAYGR